MPSELLQFSIVHIIGVSVAVFGLIASGLLIKRYCRKYQNMEIFWVPWWLVITLIMGVKFV